MKKHLIWFAVFFVGVLLISVPVEVWRHVTEPPRWASWLVSFSVGLWWGNNVRWVAEAITGSGEG